MCQPLVILVNKLPETQTILLETHRCCHKEPRVISVISRHKINNPWNDISRTVKISVIEFSIYIPNLSESKSKQRARFKCVFFNFMTPRQRVVNLLSWLTRTFIAIAGGWSVVFYISFSIRSVFWRRHSRCVLCRLLRRSTTLLRKLQDTCGKITAAVD